MLACDDSRQDLTLELSIECIENYEEEPRDWVTVRNLESCLDPVIDRHLETVKKQSKQCGHNRSRSDLANSIITTEKWMRYEEMRHQESMYEEKEAPLAEPESMCALSTLNLEHHGKFVDREDVKLFEEQQKELTEGENMYSVEQGPILKLPITELLPEIKKCLDTKELTAKRTEKKSSVSSFFNKISRAVLKPKNVYGSQTTNCVPNVKSQKDGFRMFGRRKTLSSVSSDDKENMGAVDKKFAVQDLRKIKRTKLRSSKGK